MSVMTVVLLAGIAAAVLIGIAMVLVPHPLTLGPDRIVQMLNAMEQNLKGPKS